MKRKIKRIAEISKRVKSNKLLNRSVSYYIENLNQMQWSLV